MHLIGRGLLVLLWLSAAKVEARSARIIGASSSLAQKARVMEWSGGKPRWTAATFQPASAMDGSLATAWCEGARGPGIGEWLEVQIDETVREVEIQGGFRKLSLSRDPVSEGISDDQIDGWFEQSVRTYQSNSRPEVIELTTEKGEVLERFELGDRTLSQYRFPVSLAPGRYRLRIAKVYPGTRFEDTCIAELRFRAVPEPAPDAAQDWSPAPELPEALRPFEKPLSCRPDSGVKVLPQEVRFLRMTVPLQRPYPPARPSFARIDVAVRSPSGRLSPIREATCYWDQRFICVLTGDEAGKESLDSADSISEWAVNLERSTADAADPRAWTGDYKAITETNPSVTFQMGYRPAPNGGTVFHVSAMHGDSISETARFTCAPQP